MLETGHTPTGARNSRRLSQIEIRSEAAAMTNRSNRAMVCAALGLWGLLAAAGPRAAAAEPLVSQGIGTSSCARLAADLNPAEGLNSPINLVLFAWVQGYVSAANVALLEDDAKHVDMNALDDTKVLALVQAFCKANPDKKPVAAIDDLIRKSAKIKAKWEPGTIEWDE
jgi:hypothetical protein